MKKIKNFMQNHCIIFTTKYLCLLLMLGFSFTASAQTELVYSVTQDGFAGIPFSNSTTSRGNTIDLGGSNRIVTEVNVWVFNDDDRSFELTCNIWDRCPGPNPSNSNTNCGNGATILATNTISVPSTYQATMLTIPIGPIDLTSDTRVNVSFNIPTASAYTGLGLPIGWTSGVGSISGGYTQCGDPANTFNGCLWTAIPAAPTNNHAIRVSAVEPTAVCKNASVELDNTGSVTVTPVDVFEFDVNNAQVSSISVSPSTFSCADVGTQQVTLTVTNSSGLTTSCTSTVTIEDNTGACAPSNDLCNSAIQIACGDVVQGSTIFATNDLQSNCLGAMITLQGVWYTFTGNGVSTTLSTCSANTNFDTRISVLEGTCSNLVCTPNGVNDDYSGCTFSNRHSRVDFFADLGKVYYVWVTPWNTGVATGDFELSITCDPCNDLSDPDQDGIAACFDLCPNDADIALNFARSSADHVTVPHHPDLNLVDGEFTIEAWVYPTSGEEMTIVSKGDGGNSTDTEYIFGITSDQDPNFPGRLSFTLYDTNGIPSTSYGPSTIQTNTWTHVAFSLEQLAIAGGYGTTFFINGVETLTGTPFLGQGVSWHQSSSDFFIGREGAMCQCDHFNGSIDEVAVWDKLLTQVEISASMAAPYSGSEPGLIAYYDFNDANACVTNTTNTTLADGANNHNGTLVNFALGTSCTSNWAAGQNEGACEPVCAPNLDLTSNQTTNADYESGGYISSDQTIMSPAQVDYDATTEIILLENFEVQSGSIFHAFIDGCGNL